MSKLKSEFSFLELPLAQRLVRSYGTNAWVVMQGASDIGDMGRDFGGSLTAREVAYLMQHEWAECAEDVIWRRSKLGICLDKQEVSALEKWMKKQFCNHFSSSGIEVIKC